MRCPGPLAIILAAALSAGCFRVEEPAPRSPPQPRPVRLSATLSTWRATVIAVTPVPPEENVASSGNFMGVRVRLGEYRGPALEATEKKGPAMGDELELTWLCPCGDAPIPVGTTIEVEFTVAGSWWREPPGTTERALPFRDLLPAAHPLAALYREFVPLAQTYARLHHDLPALEEAFATRGFKRYYQTQSAWIHFTAEGLDLNICSSGNPKDAALTLQLSSPDGRYINQGFMVDTVPAQPLAMHGGTTREHLFDHAGIGAPAEGDD